MGEIQVLVDERKNLTIFTVTGSITFDDIIKKVAAFYSGIPTLFAIWDVSAADLRTISHEDIQRIADFGFKFTPTRSGGKTAFVAPEDLSFGITRVFAAITETQGMPIEVGSFRSMNEAKKWLGID